MGPRSLTQRADRTISALAGRQRGVVARGQLLAAGVTGRQIKRRLALVGEARYRRLASEADARGLRVMVTGRQIRRDPDGVLRRGLAALAG